jgi:hypothetical protein
MVAGVDVDREAVMFELNTLDLEQIATAPADGQLAG